jgi:DNA-binding NtrC family response regulator
LQSLDRARRIFVNLKDNGRAAQVDETRACVFLKEKRIAEAERVARSAVRVQEKSGNPGLLAEALITHGRALARLTRYSASLTAFRRAIDLSNKVGAVSRAGEAALAAFNEIGEHLVVSERSPISFGRSWERDKLSVEREVIKRALEHAKGSITDAARALGTSWQTLGYALRTRHKDLLKYRTPVRKRSRKQTD